MYVRQERWRVGLFPFEAARSSWNNEENMVTSLNIHARERRLSEFMVVACPFCSLLRLFLLVLI